MRFANVVPSPSWLKLSWRSMSSVWWRASLCRRPVNMSERSPARARTRLIWRTIAYSRRVADAACATGGGAAAGTEASFRRKRKAATLAAQEARDVAHKLRILQPRPMARAGYDARGRIAERVGVGLCEARRHVRVAL